MFTLYSSQTYFWIIPNPDHPLNSSINSRQEFTFVPGQAANTLTTTTSTKSQASSLPPPANDHFQYCILIDRQRQHILLIDRDTGVVILDPYLWYIFGLTPHKDLLSSFNTHSFLPVCPLPTANTHRREIYGILGLHRLIRGLYLEVITQVEAKVSIYGNTIYHVKNIDLLCVSGGYPSGDLNRNHALQDEEMQNMSLLRKALSSLSLHFSYNYDITLSLQKAYDFGTLQHQQAVQVKEDATSMTETGKTATGTSNSDTTTSTNKDSVIVVTSDGKKKKIDPKKLDDDKKKRSDKKPRRTFQDDDELLNDPDIDNEPKSLLKTSIVTNIDDNTSENVVDNETNKKHVDDNNNNNNNIDKSNLPKLPPNYKVVNSVIEYPQWTYSQFTSQLLSRAEGEYFTNVSPLVILFTEMMYSYQSILEDYVSQSLSSLDERIKSKSKGKISTHDEDLSTFTQLQSLIIKSPSTTAPLPHTSYPSVLSSFSIIACHSYINTTHVLEPRQSIPITESLPLHLSAQYNKEQLTNLQQSAKFQLTKQTTVQRISRFNLGPRSQTRGIDNLAHAGNSAQVEFITEVYYDCTLPTMSVINKDFNPNVAKMGSKNNPLQFVLFAVGSYLVFRGSPPCLLRDVPGPLSPILLSPLQVEPMDDITQYQELAFGQDYHKMYPPGCEKYQDEKETSQQQQPQQPQIDPTTGQPIQRPPKQDPLHNKQRVLQLISQHCANIIKSNFPPSFIDNRTLLLDNPFITTSLSTHLDHKLREYYLPHEYNCNDPTSDNNGNNNMNNGNDDNNDNDEQSQAALIQQIPKLASNSTTLQNQQFYQQLTVFAGLAVPYGPQHQQQEQNPNQVDFLSPFTHFYEPTDNVFDMFRSERDRAILGLCSLLDLHIKTNINTHQNGTKFFYNTSTIQYQQLFSSTFEPLLRVSSLLSRFQKFSNKKLQQLQEYPAVYNNLDQTGPSILDLQAIPGHNAKLINSRISYALSHSFTQYSLSERTVRIKKHLLRYLPGVQSTLKGLVSTTKNGGGENKAPAQATESNKSAQSQSNTTLPHVVFVDYAGNESMPVFISSLRHTLAREGSFLAIVPNFLDAIAANRSLSIDPYNTDLSTTHTMTYYLPKAQNNDNVVSTDDGVEYQSFFHSDKVELTLYTPFAYQIPLPSFTQMLFHSYQPPLTSTMTQGYQPFRLVQISRQVSYSRYSCLDSIDRTGKAIAILYPNYTEYISTYLSNLISFSPAILHKLPMFAVNRNIGYLDALPYILQFTQYIREFIILHSLGINFHPQLYMPMIDDKAITSSPSSPSSPSLSSQQQQQQQPHRYKFHSLSPSTNEVLFDQVIQICQQFTRLVTTTWMLWTPQWSKFQSAYKLIKHLHNTVTNNDFYINGINMATTSSTLLMTNNNANIHPSLTKPLLYTTAHQSTTPRFMEGYDCYHLHTETTYPLQTPLPYYHTAHQNSTIIATFYGDNYNSIVNNYQTMESLYQHIELTQYTLQQSSKSDKKVTNKKFDKYPEGGPQLHPTYQRLAYAVDKVIDINPRSLHSYLNISPPIWQTTGSVPVEYQSKPQLPVIYMTNSATPVVQDDLVPKTNNRSILSEVSLFTQLFTMLCSPFTLVQAFILTIFQFIRMNPLFHHIKRRYVDNFAAATMYEAFSVYFTNYRPTRSLLPLTGFVVKPLPPPPSASLDGQPQPQQPPRFGLFQMYEHTTEANVEQLSTSTSPNPLKYTRDFNPYTKITTWLPLVGAIMTLFIAVTFLFVGPMLITIPDLRVATPLSPLYDPTSTNIPSQLLPPMTDEYKQRYVENIDEPIAVKYDLNEQIDPKYYSLVSQITNQSIVQSLSYSLLYPKVLLPYTDTPLYTQQCVIDHIYDSLVTQRDEILSLIKTMKAIERYHNVALIRGQAIADIPVKNPEQLDERVKNLHIRQDHLASAKSLLFSLYQHQYYGLIDFMNLSLLSDTVMYRDCQVAKLFTPAVNKFVEQNTPTITSMTYNHYSTLPMKQSYWFNPLAFSWSTILISVIIPITTLWLLFHFLLFAKLRTLLRIQRHWFTPPLTFTQQLQRPPLATLPPPPPPLPNGQPPPPTSPFPGN